MPTSSFFGKQETLGWFRKHEDSIRRILDIGAGSGTYPNLIKNAGICKDAEWVGVEVWEPYVSQYQLQNKYNKLIIQDVRKLDWNDLGKFSVAIAGDVLEHITKDEAIVLVDKILEHVDTLIVSIPIVHYPQGPYQGNPHEEHVKDDWSHTEMIETWQHYIKDSWKHDYSDVGVYWLSK